MGATKFTMSFASSIIAVLSLTSTALGACMANGNNCARAVTGTFKSLATARASDCNANLACTVTPAVSTIYTTTTVFNPAFTGTPSSPVVSAKTQCKSGFVPSYASACTSFAAYSSACSCAGAPGTTVTTTTPVSTVTVTASGPNPACSTYVLQANGGTLAGLYAFSDQTLTIGGGRTFDTASRYILSGTSFYDSGLVNGVPYYIGTAKSNDAPDVFVYPDEYVNPLQCTVAATNAPGTSGRVVSCVNSSGGRNQLRACGNDVQIRSASEAGCDDLQLIAIPACS